MPIKSPSRSHPRAMIGGLAALVIGSTIVAMLVVRHADGAAWGRVKKMTAMQTICSGRWQAPSLINPLHADALLHALATSVSGRGPTYILTNTLGADVPARPLKVMSSDGADVGAPRGEFEFAFPQGAVDEHGTLHMVWGEPDSLDSRETSDWLIMRIRSLWTASYSPTTRSWSEPRRLIKTRRAAISWTRANAVVWSSGHAMLTSAVSMPDGPGGRGPAPPGFVILLDLDSTWSARTVQVPGQKMPVQATAMRLGDTTLVAVGGPRLNAESDLRIVVLHGQHASLEMEMPRSGQIENIRLIDGGTGGIHLVWKETDPRLGGSLTHAARDRRQGHWSPPLTWSAGRGTGNERFALDACGVIHATFETSSDDGVFGLYDARFTTEWQSPQLLYSGLSPRNADIVAFANGRMMMAFQASLAGQKGGSLIAWYSR